MSHCRGVARVIGRPPALAAALALVWIAAEAHASPPAPHAGEAVTVHSVKRVSSPLSASASATAALAPAPAKHPTAPPPATKQPASKPAAEPPDPNDPLERLYGRKQLNFSKGAPSISVRLMGEQKSVTFQPKGRMRLLARGGLNKTLDAPAGTWWTVRLKNFEPAEVAWSVQVAEVRHADKVGLARARELWTSRGYQVRSATSGSVFGIAGHVLDNRRYNVFLGPPLAEEPAKELLKGLHREVGAQGNLVPSLRGRPHGVLEVIDESGAVVALAQDLVTALSPEGAPFLVKEVEHGIGYSWHGRQDRTYRGNLQFVVDRSGGIAVVNELPMEEYLRGIVPSEIFAKAHPEALKAQAVTARGEVLAKIGTRHLTDPYVLCAEQHCQVYSGMSGEAATTDAAIVATAGQALFAPDGGPLVNSVYSAVCGGHTEDNEVVWGGLSDPVLRGKPDLVEPPPPALMGGIGDKNLNAFLTGGQKAYCSVSSFSSPKKYRWERRFTQAEVDAIARPFGVGQVRVMAVAHRGASGRASILTIAGDEGATQIRGELTIRRLFRNLNSAMFEVQGPGSAQPGEWVFRGGGWGHGVGMCQVGAIGRAEHGHSYREILRHYFNGAEIAKIY